MTRLENWEKFLQTFFFFNVTIFLTKMLLFFKMEIKICFRVSMEKSEMQLLALNHVISATAYYVSEESFQQNIYGL